MGDVASYRNSSPLYPFHATQQGTERDSSGVALAYFFGRDSGGTRPGNPRDTTELTVVFSGMLDEAPRQVATCGLVH